MGDVFRMRTTLDIDDDVLLAAKEVAPERGVPAGKILSELARRSLQRSKASRTRNGVRLFPYRRGAPVVTSEQVNRLRDGAP